MARVGAIEGAFMRLRLVGAILALVLALTLSSCSQQPSPKVTPPTPVRPASVTTISAAGVSMSLTIQSALLKAGTTQAADIALENRSETTREVSPEFLLAVKDSSGSIVWRTPIQYKHTRPISLPPGGTTSARLEFPVPAVGQCALEGYAHVFPSSEMTAVVRFRSFK
jgi:hypothetical protein